MKKLLLAVTLFASMSFVTACGTEEDQSLLQGEKPCNVAPLTIKDLKLPKAKGFGFSIDSAFYKGGANHRARDVIARAGQDLTLHAKFTYKFLDKDMKGEKVDIYLVENCSKKFQKLGSVTTSYDDQNPTIENVRDSGGRIFPKLSQLGIRGGLPIGRYQVFYVVPADNSYAESYIEVVAPNQKYVLSDIDGTLTSSELAAASHIINISPSAHPGAAEALGALAARGYKIFYLTARPEWLMPATRQWLKEKNFPKGAIHTTDSKIGAQGEAAIAFKKAQIALLKAQTGITPSYAFGNKQSDVDAFGESGIPAANSYYFDLKGDAKGGKIHKDYRKLVPELSKANLLQVAH